MNKPQKTCSLCPIEHYGRNWCQMHYMRWYRHGDPLYLDPRVRNHVCTLRDCTRAHYGRGLCVMHYQQWRRS